MKRNIALEKVIEPVVNDLGCELAGLELLSQGKYTTLRVYIDKADGVKIDDCEQVSRRLGAVLDVESELVRGAYTLEVSSPGIDRKIFTPEQFPRYVGKQVRVSVQVPINGQRNFKGTLSSVAATQIELEINGSVVNVDFANIAQANVIDEAK